MIQIDIEKLLEVGIALSQEKNGDRLLHTILTAAMEITSCDGGTLYINRGDSLEFQIMITKSMGIYRGVGGEPIDLPPVLLHRENVCARAILDSRLVNVPDVYESGSYDFSGPRKYDEITGYRTISMLVVPMENDFGDKIGVLQLINAKDGDDRTIPFAPEYERVIQSLASQAAICLTSMNYAAEVTGLFDSFVKVMSSAIDARTPYNANHTKNMVRFGELFINWLNGADRNWHFTEEEKRQFLMSVWLHDVGKLVTPLEVMNKESRLGRLFSDVQHRFEIMELNDQIFLLKGTIDEDEAKRRSQERASAMELIQVSNKAISLPDEVMEQLEQLGKRVFLDFLGESHFWLTSEEVESLLVKKGNLTPEERGIMEEHVVATERMLRQMRFCHNYTKVPEWAAAHHEFLNGGGYPKKLSGKQIPREARLLTILDIFEALTAHDRPYKLPVQPEKALAILEEMAECGQLDDEIIALFKESGVWRCSLDESL